MVSESFRHSCSNRTNAKEATPIKTLLLNFFTHKDFLPPPQEWPGTLFTPLQIIFCLAAAVFIGYASIRCAKKSAAFRKGVYCTLWLIMLATEPAIVLWEACAGSSIFFDPRSALSLWPCSIFLYAAPFAIFGKGKVRYAACGYICTLGLLGGTVNFVYPATYLSRYSCLSMAGLRTIFYHGAMVFTAVTMLLSGEHSFRNITRTEQMLLPAVPALLVSIPALAANAIIPGADYMFFRLDSFFFAPLGQLLPDFICVLVVFFLYLVIHAAPYLPSWLKNRKAAPEKADEPPLAA